MHEVLQTSSTNRIGPPANTTNTLTHTLLLPVCVPPQIELYAERYANNNQRKDADDAMMLLLLLLERPRQNHGHGNKIKRSTKKQYTIIKTKTPGTNLPSTLFPILLANHWQNLPQARRGSSVQSGTSRATPARLGCCLFSGFRLFERVEYWKRAMKIIKLPVCMEKPPHHIPVASGIPMPDPGRETPATPELYYTPAVHRWSKKRSS